MRRLRVAVRREDGVAMVLVVALYAMLVLLAVTLIATVLAEGTRSATAVRRDAAFQAAEAGIDDYTAKLVDDHGYYAHYVHPGESTREAAGGAVVAAGEAWNGELTWTYPNGEDTWRQLSNGYEYNLQVWAPTESSPTVKIVATGRKQGSTTDYRVVETLIRPSSVADFQRIVNGNVSWGSGASTYGRIYSAGNVTHNGTAYGNIYAEGSITGSVVMMDGAQKYDSATIRTVIENPINYSSFLTSLVDIQRAAAISGVGLYLDDAAASAWRLTFNSDGTITVQQCGGSSVDTTQPTCPRSGTTTQTYAVPSNGAVYVAQTAIVSGQVHGRVTVASNDNIVIADNITYVTSGSDVLGLDAKNNVITAAWGPVDLTWRGAVIAQTGTWRGAGSTADHDTMTFSGAAVTQDGGAFSGMYETRNYSYDETLLYVQPPWFPTVEDAYTVVLFRELPAQ